MITGGNCQVREAGCQSTWKPRSHNSKCDNLPEVWPLGSSVPAAAGAASNLHKN